MIPLATLPDGAAFRDALGRSWVRVRATGDCDGSILCRITAEARDRHGVLCPTEDYFAPTAPVTEVE